MSRLREDDLKLPLYAAIRRQQATRVSIEAQARVDAILEHGPNCGAMADGREQRQEDCWIVEDQEEPLRYI